MARTERHRVLWVVQGSDWIGEQTEFVHLAKRLPEGWIGCLVFLRKPDNLDAIQQVVAHRNVTVTSLGMRGYRTLPVVLLRFLRLIRRFRPAVVHSHHPPANLVNGWSKPLAAAFLSHRYRTLFGYRNSAEGLRFRGRFLERLNRQLADQVICSSPGVERSFFGDSHLLSDGTEVRQSRRKHWTLFNAVDVDGLRRQRDGVLESGRDPKTDGAVRRIISVAAFKEQKGHRTLLTAFQRLCERVSAVELVLVGDGPLRGEMEQLAESLGIAQRCFFCGHQRDPVPWLAHADLFVLASYWEGLPKALLEAMALDLPCVATRVEGVEDVLDGDSLVAPWDSAALADALETQLVDPEAARARVEAQRAVIERFNIDSTAMVAFDVYRELSGSGTKMRG
ncbi:glycosyltransferase [Halorhodospira halochloris]|uniref:glycosyltransferase n=1 Tax=Halorhodospira halochloris TaxID=1052 RepID=UPI001EE8FED1|nr:glycosyltransferase [Halorhodospira halochloris]MCG5531214.1 glycosyltransferase [Halorhodospira halochloris]